MSETTPLLPKLFVPGVVTPFKPRLLRSPFSGVLLLFALGGMLSGCDSVDTPSSIDAGGPSAPTDVSATAGNGQVTVSWSPVPGADGYHLYWGTAAGVTENSGTRIGNVTSPYVHTGLTNGTTYYYVVFAFNAATEGPLSQEVNAAPDAPAAALSCGPITIRNGYVPVQGALQAAIDATAAGGTLNVAAGRYNEDIRINKPITIIGAGKGQTVIAKSAENGTIMEIVNAGDVVLTDLTVSGWEDFGNRATAGIYVERTNITLTDVSVSDIGFTYVYINRSPFLFTNVELLASESPGYLTNSDLGIHIVESSGVFDGLSNDTQGNIDHVITRQGCYQFVDGEMTYTDSPLDSTNVTIRNSTITGRNFDWGDGIRWHNGLDSHLLIENNVFTGHPNSPVPYPGGNDPTVARYPAAITVSGNITIKGNTITGFPRAISLQGLDPKFLLSGNHIENTEIAIWSIAGSATKCAVDFGGGSLGSVGGNTFLDNIYFNIYLSTGCGAHAIGNDWSTADSAVIDDWIYDSQDSVGLGTVILN